VRKLVTGAERVVRKLRSLWNGHNQQFPDFAPPSAWKMRFSRRSQTVFDPFSSAQVYGFTTSTVKKRIYILRMNSD